MTRIGNSDLDVFPIGLGGNVFGYTADDATSRAILDAWVAGGANFIDTADSYSAWAPGNVGGESETIIGHWLAASGKRADVIIATKVGKQPQFRGQSAANIRTSAEASLRRMGIDTIDLYYAHEDDATVPLEESVTAYADLVRDGKVRHVGLSNFTPERTEAWIATAQTLGGPLPVALQPNYSLVHRNDVEDDLMPLAATHGLGIIPYSSLAGGFLTGKYRSTTIAPGASPRAPGATRFVTPQGLAIIDTLARIGSAHGASATAVALAWLRAQPQVVAPLASASRVAQVPDLLAGGLLELSPDEVAELSSVSAWTPA